MTTKVMKTDDKQMSFLFKKGKMLINVILCLKFLITTFLKEKGKKMNTLREYFLLLFEVN